MSKLKEPLVIDLWLKAEIQSKATMAYGWEKMANWMFLRIEKIND